MTFEAFPKVPRLSRECTITEKIDGTNAQVLVLPALEQSAEIENFVIARGVGNTAIYAGSRKRFITPASDNFGFASWVLDHADELIEGLGYGQHFGEWWGAGIQRGYGLDHKRFSLFNVGRWINYREYAHSDADDGSDKRLPAPACCHVVPVLYQGPFDTEEVDDCLTYLEKTGSRAAPGFMNPEGVMVWHTAAHQMFKKTLGGDGHKG